MIQSGWSPMGQRVRSFEETFASAHAKLDAVAVNSCTAALHLILAALGIGPGDEVLVPALTFVATANSVVYTGAKPVFVDIEELDTPFLSLANPHFAGYLVDKEAWQQLARERGLHLIEDAAHAAGVREAGSIGEAAAFSFYGNKNMTTAEGGAVTASNPQVLAKVRQMRQHGMTTGTFERLSSRQAAYDVTMLGFNYRMDELRAALGLVQLQHLAEWNAKRKALTRQYMDLLYDRCPGVLAPFRKSQGTSSSNHIMQIVRKEC